MADLGRRNVVTGWHREPYAFADDAYLWTSNTGHAILYFRNGSLVVEVRGALDDVKFFAPHAYQRTAPDNKSGMKVEVKYRFLLSRQSLD
jgi:hypothetical protein